MTVALVIDPVRTHAAAMPGRLAVGDAKSGRLWTWRELDQAADQAAAWLVSRLGHASRQRVAVLSRNHPYLLVLQFACARAGAIFVPLNWRLAASEIGDILKDAQPALLFHGDGICVPPDSIASLPLRDLELLGEPGSRAPDTARLGWDEPMTLLYTSGTSGKPKGVIVTEANVFWSNANFALSSHVSQSSVFLCDMPMFHTAGLLTGVRVPIWAGATLWISAGFDPPTTIARIADRELGITHYFSVPQMATALWQHPDFTPDKFAQLTMYATGGAPNPKAQVERFARSGIRFSDGFGMSETGSNFGMPITDMARTIAKAGSCGLPFLSIQPRIVDSEGRDVAIGQAGELWLRGPSVTPGYWNQPEMTARAFVDGWFRTGDIAIQDEDGFFYLVDRRKDMYISGGENVYPAEVEGVLAELAEIAMAAVIGVPDERWGEVGRAFVVLQQGKALSVDAIAGHCLARLAKFKVPVEIIITDAIPQTASGKVQKHLLPR